MTKVVETYYWLTDTYSMWGVWLMIAVALLWIVQLYYYLIAFGRIPSYRERNVHASKQSPSVSILVALYQADFEYLEKTLPLLLGQEYDGAWEVVVVDLSCKGEFAEQLDLIRRNNPRLSVTQMRQSDRFPISLKMALNVGIKRAQYDNVLITTADCFPRSKRWLALMARGLRGGSIVLGYAGLETGGKQRILRMARVAQSMRWMSRATHRKPYGGTICNIGFSRQLYFDSHGFDHQNMNLGEGDLYVQRIANRRNTSLIINPQATVSQHVWGGMDWWSHERRFYSYPFRYYPCGVKLYVRTELWSRMLFFAVSAATIAMMPFEIKIGAAALVLLRFIAVEVLFSRTCRRLGERHLSVGYFVYDLFSPIYEGWLVIVRRLKPSAGIWR